MTGKKQQNEHRDELRDLDVPAEQAGGIVGGGLENTMVSGYAVTRPSGKGGGTPGAGWDIRSGPKGV